MKNLFTLIFLFIYSLTSAKNDPQITGAISDDQGQDVPYATVLLQKATDTSMVKADISDEAGNYTFLNVPAGTYFIEVTFVGYGTSHSAPFQFDGKSVFKVPSIILSQQTEQLSEVVVKSSRPIVEVQPDKTVFNVDGSVNAVGNTALELLRKSPGVVVDNNENLILQGKNGVQVYIDGKKSPLSGDDLANYLKSLQSTEIDAIEIITNPSAKYDAEGNAGIINIRLKKDQGLGFNGTATGGYRYGKNSKYNGSASLNYRESNFNTFGSYNIYSGENLSEFFLFREQGGNAYDQSNIDLGNSTNHGFRIGTDLFINKKNTIGILVNGSLNDHNSITNSNTNISSLADGIIDSFLVASNKINSSRDNVNFNLNYAFRGENDKSLNIDFDYGYYRNNTNSFQPNQYLAEDGFTTLFERTFSNVTPTDIDIYTGKIDYETNFAKGKLALGVKSSLVETDNTFDNYDIIEGERIKNLDRSNNFVYRENVNAAYSSWQRKISEKININIGLRVEHTNSMGDLTSTQTNMDEAVERDYVDFFPSGGITLQANDNNSWRLAYSRRIDRPSYQDLNPFEFQLDELTFQRGNPFLNPQYSNSYSLTHTYKYTLNSTLSYTVISDVFTQITDAVDDRKATLTNINLAEQKNLALSVSYPFTITKWWNVYATATAYHLENNADIDGKIIDLNVNAFNFYGQNTFMLPKGFKAELSGWYNAPTLWGNWVTNSQYDVSAGISKKFWDDAATLKISVSDLFYTNGWGGESRFGQLYMRGGGNWESRQLRVNFTYLFGNKQVKSARNRKTGIEEEQSRIKG
ncbi:MAG: TonB-dependent receptor [Saprospiraceae bacterium]|nr:TonB-dependent receptor [Saprospiraceae bacterium]